MGFAHFPNRPETLTPEFLEGQFNALAERLDTVENAESADGWLALIRDWNDLKAYLIGEMCRRQYAWSKDTRDQEAENELKFLREKLGPVADKGNSVIIAALLKSKYKDAIKEAFSPLFVDAMDYAKEVQDPVNSELRVECANIASDYDKLRGSAKVEVQGRSITLTQAKNMVSADDAELRKDAFLKYRQWFLDQRPELSKIYSQLVERRHKMGQNLGYDNYLPLGYKGMSRFDYGPEQVKVFRDNVRQFITPVFKALLEKQAQALGQDSLKPWDFEYDPQLNLPSGVAHPISSQLDKAEQVFEKLAPELVGHFKRMRKDGLIDLENREGKAPGAYCTSFPDEQRSAIFCNSVGDMDDVGTLMHEMGHSFQAWESQAIELVELRSPSLDACEIHSMGMEYLTLNYLNEFFEDAHCEKYQRWRWRDSIQLICYCCVVDEFQHWVYEHPQASPDERDETWDRLYDTYVQGIDWQGAEQYKAARWYAQLHIFHMPFYYIDYAIAELAAMQLALIDAADHDQAMKTYLNLCRIGGTQSVLQIFKTAGMRSPFDAGVMKDLMTHASKVLGLTAPVSAG